MPPAKRATRKTAKSSRSPRATKPRQPKKVAAKKTTKKLSPRHKAALATGRTEARHVAAYLDALEAHKPRPGRQRTVESIQRQLTDVRASLKGAAGMKKLELVARRIELENELDAKKAGSDLSELRKNFVKSAGGYARRKGIPKQAFREAGVPAADIAAAKIP
jgi:hypothetical protein